MDLKATAKHVEVFIRSNSPEILSGVAVGGVIGTSYLTHNAAFTAGYRQAVIDERMSGPSGWKESIKEHWKLYIPSVATGAITVACIIASTRIGSRRTAAMAAAYSISERAFSEYKEKVKEKLGEKKEQSVRDAIAEDKVRANPPGEKFLLVGDGNVLCYELHTGRSFVSSMAILQKAENELNARILREDYAYLHNFYDLAGIPHTESDYDFGWTSDRLMELEFTSLIHEDKPVLAFAYNYYKPL